MREYGGGVEVFLCCVFVACLFFLFFFFEKLKFEGEWM